MHLKLVREFQGSDHLGWRDRLFALNVRHVEQLGSLLAAPEGRYALERLGVPVESVQKAVEPILIDRFGLSLSQPLRSEGGQKPLLTRARYPMGFHTRNTDPFQEASFGTALPDPPVFSFPPPNELPPALDLPAERLLGRDPQFEARDQGRRGTCVAFAVMGMYQLMRAGKSSRSIQLSPQYLYFLAKSHDLFPDEDSTSIDAALHMLMVEGCCLEHHLEYHPRHDIAQRYRVRGHTPRKTFDGLKGLAALYKIESYRSVGHTADAIKAELAADRPVGVGIAIYQLAWYNSLARNRGEIAMPPMDTSGAQVTLLDTYLGGHAIVLVGYRDNSMEADEDSHRPGGGYFVFRNSWGEDWASQNDYARGYGYIPYEYLNRFCLEAAVIDRLAAPKSSRATSATRGSRAGTGGRKGSGSAGKKVIREPDGPR